MTGQGYAMTRRSVGWNDASPQRIPGDPGVWVFIIGDMAIFTALFGVILFHRADDPRLFATSQRALNQGLGLTNTVVLLCGSILVVLAARAVAEARHAAASRLLRGAIACGLAFTTIKLAEYGMTLHDGSSMHTSDFYMLFFAITGAHLLHVLVGVGGLMLLRRRVALGLPGPRDHALFDSGACYWHMVDLLWLILFPLFYLVN